MRLLCGGITNYANGGPKPVRVSGLRKNGHVSAVESKNCDVTDLAGNSRCWKTWGEADQCWLDIESFIENKIRKKNYVQNVNVGSTASLQHTVLMFIITGLGDGCDTPTVKVNLKKNFLSPRGWVPKKRTPPNTTRNGLEPSLYHDKQSRQAGQATTKHWKKKGRK